jgi:tRNA G18 (ribose-2'-O)-methylase SpoU
MKKLMLILHNIRSVYNVGAILRTAEGFGVETVIFSGYTPNFLRGLPHEVERLRQRIAKTALGSEKMIATEFANDILAKIDELKKSGWQILALEQSDDAARLDVFEPMADKLVLILGEEVNGIDQNLLRAADVILEIPMFGKKESFNVSVATGIALYALRVK